jgi:hypothetical protein
VVNRRTIMIPRGFQELSDAEREEVCALHAELLKLLCGHNLMINLAALINIQLSLITMLAESEQEARDFVRLLVETLLVNAKRAPGAWAYMQEVRAALDKTPH